MTNQLPASFIQKMSHLLGEEADAFLTSYQQARLHGLRVNTLKLSANQFAARSPFSVEPVAWCESGFYYDESSRPGKHPYHAAGVYYIQEPSAMAVAEVLQIEPGDRVLDLAAAPGGKATQAGQALQGQGLLVANEIHPARAKILSENIERMGIRNAIVTNEPPDRLAQRFPAFFDKMIVDAPCSGEGMFRKDDTAVEEWSQENVERCALRQDEILRYAAGMLKPGGTMVYSTCTFSPEENEQTILRFLWEHSDYELIPVPQAAYFMPGRTEWAAGTNKADFPLHFCCRLWPHRLRGEGHFLALLRRKTVIGESPLSSGTRTQKKNKQPKARPDTTVAWRLFQQFSAEHLRIEMPPAGFERLFLFGDQLYLLPESVPNLEKVKVIRPGWHLGTVKKDRFEPSHALALSLRAEEVRRTYDLDSRQPDDRAFIETYLHGDTLPYEGDPGWVLVTVDRFPLGWGKASGGQLKNHYPKGLRIP
ncbi:RsmF rRNA methyltransferase first C-terminal domain-containing protein [Effusibacillus dendaii]|uniref:Methylase n=1 Tax=Effusibacillus dendaii TaxID=2743772 RepID=A0A7I8D4N3_9BACL|nr:RsmB/NOP family class I SAM-dependent RNA methyltransferase [Effusibacillus dendaii]BCJ85044.1 methylase [Effusibacillus dendaii]